MQHVVVFFCSKYCVKNIQQEHSFDKKAAIFTQMLKTKGNQASQGKWEKEKEIYMSQGGPGGGGRRVAETKLLLTQRKTKQGAQTHL